MRVVAALALVSPLKAVMHFCMHVICSLNSLAMIAACSSSVNDGAGTTADVRIGPAGAAGGAFVMVRRTGVARKGAAAVFAACGVVGEGCAALVDCLLADFAAPPPPA